MGGCPGPRRANIAPMGSSVWAESARAVCLAVSGGPVATDALLAVVAASCPHPLDALAWAEARGFVRYRATETPWRGRDHRGSWEQRRCAHCGDTVAPHDCAAPRWAALDAAAAMPLRIRKAG